MEVSLRGKRKGRREEKAMTQWGWLGTRTKNRSQDWTQMITEARRRRDKRYGWGLGLEEDYSKTSPAPCSSSESALESEMGRGTAVLSTMAAADT